jgi:pantetheine-phosphate adenylyltransferase
MGDRTAVYPGSFDPITYGHLDILYRGLKIFDKIIIAVAKNIEKNPLFTVEERMEMIRETLKGSENVIVDSFEGLLVDYLRKMNAKFVIRGLRAMSDFDYEFQMASVNRTLNPDIDTIFMMTSRDFFFISSRTVKEVASYGGSVKEFVPPNVEKRLKEKFQVSP